MRRRSHQTTSALPSRACHGQTPRDDRTPATERQVGVALGDGARAAAAARRGRTTRRRPSPRRTRRWRPRRRRARRRRTRAAARHDPGARGARATSAVPSREPLSTTITEKPGGTSASRAGSAAPRRGTGSTRSQARDLHVRHARDSQRPAERRMALRKPDVGLGGRRLDPDRHLAWPRAATPAAPCALARGARLPWGSAPRRPDRRGGAGAAAHRLARPRQPALRPAPFAPLARLCRPRGRHRARRSPSPWRAPACWYGLGARRPAPVAPPAADDVRRRRWRGPLALAFVDGPDGLSRALVEPRRVPAAPPAQVARRARAAARATSPGSRSAPRAAGRPTSPATRPGRCCSSSASSQLGLGGAFAAGARGHRAGRRHDPGRGAGDAAAPGPRTSPGAPRRSSCWRRPRSGMAVSADAVFAAVAAWGLAAWRSPRHRPAPAAGGRRPSRRAAARAAA